MKHTKNDVDQWSAIKKMMSRLSLFILPFFMLVAAMPASAAEQENVRKDGWQFEANVYMWGAAISGETASGNTIDVSFSDLVKKLQLGFMGGAGVRNGRWSFTTDAMYMKLKDQSSGQVTAPVGPGVNIDVNAELKFQSWMVTSAFGYSIVDTDKVRLDLLAGARYLWLKPELDLDVHVGPLQPRNRTLSTSGSGWDGIVGIRGNVNLDKKWYVPYCVDVGTGDSPFTWQAMGGVGYKLSKVVDVVAAYRYLYWKFSKNEVIDKMDFSGPLVGVIFRF